MKTPSLEKMERAAMMAAEACAEDHRQWPTRGMLITCLKKAFVEGAGYILDELNIDGRKSAEVNHGADEADVAQKLRDSSVQGTGV